MSKGMPSLFIIVVAEYFQDRLATWVAGTALTQADAVACLRDDVREFLRFLHDDATEEQLDELLESDLLTWDQTYTTMGDDYRMCSFDDDEVLRKWNAVYLPAPADDEVPS